MKDASVVQETPLLLPWNEPAVSARAGITATPLRSISVTAMLRRAYGIWICNQRSVSAVVEHHSVCMSPLKPFHARWLPPLNSLLALAIQPWSLFAVRKGR